jgi:hypothetical protein
MLPYLTSDTHGLPWLACLNSTFYSTPTLSKLRTTVRLEIKFRYAGLDTIDSSPKLQKIIFSTGFSPATIAFTEGTQTHQMARIGKPTASRNGY